MIAGSALDNIFILFKDKYKYIIIIIIIFHISYFSIENFKKLRLYDEVKYDKTFELYHSNKDYFPIKSYNNLDYINSIDSSSISIINGDAKIKVLENNTPYMKFKVDNINKTTYIEIPRLYYLGYKITDDKKNTLKYSESKYGLIQTKLQEDGIYEVKYTGTTLYKIVVILKILLISLLSILLIRKYIMKKEIIFKNTN